MHSNGRARQSAVPVDKTDGVVSARRQGRVKHLLSNAVFTTHVRGRRGCLCWTWCTRRQKERRIERDHWLLTKVLVAQLGGITPISCVDNKGGDAEKRNKKIFEGGRASARYVVGGRNRHDTDKYYPTQHSNSKIQLHDVIRRAELSLQGPA